MISAWQMQKQILWKNTLKTLYNFIFFSLTLTQEMMCAGYASW